MQMGDGGRKNSGKGWEIDRGGRRSGTEEATRKNNGKFTTQGKL